MQSCEFLDHFQDIKDPRINRKKLYTCDEILLLTLCAVICGADGWEDVESYGKVKLDYLRHYLPYKNGTPSDDTLRRFFRALDSDYFQEKFCQWVNSITSGEDIKLISIDGKTSRHSFDGSQSAMHLISAFASEARIVLCQEKVDNKTNEIKAIPNLLDWLDLRGAIITIDAMGCQYKIADKIKNKGGDYIFSLKGNQTNLSKDIKLFFNDQMLLQDINAEVFEDIDYGHGRIETRKCTVVNNAEWLKKEYPQWHSIEAVVQIESIREVNNKITKETRFYISSKVLSAKQMLHSIRSHWSIENSLHWVMDMSFGDDQSRIRKGNAPQNMAIIKHMALNMIRKVKPPRKSIKGMRKMAGWHDICMNDIICQHIF